MSITKAVIAVAGWGARRLPITKSIEKCMLPIGNRPMVDYVVQDCIAAGITDIYFIVSEGSSQIQNYYSDNGALNAYLIANNKDEWLPVVAPPKNVRFHYIAQDALAKYGTAIPISLAFSHINHGESVVFLGGDDCIYNPDGSSEIARLIAATPENGNAMLGANIAREEVGKYGVLQLNEQSEFVRIVEKPTPQEAPSTLINISKYVLNYDLLQAIAHYAEVPISGEYYITEPINQYVIGGGSLRVVEARGTYLDSGTLQGWLHANNVVVSNGVSA